MLDMVKRALPLSPAVLLVGCGVFGVATKGDLAKQQAALEQRDQEIVAEAKAIRTELESAGRELEELERAFAPRLESLEAELAALAGIRDRMDRVARRLEDVRQELTIVEGRTRQELQRLDADLAVASAGAAEAHEVALTADERGRRLGSTWIEGMRAERRRLQRELEELDERLDAFRGVTLESRAALRETEEPAPR